MENQNEDMDKAQVKLEERSAGGGAAVGDVAPVEKKKKAKALGWKIATGVLSAAILGAGGFLVYHFCVDNHEPCDQQACEIAEARDEETGEIVKVVKVPVGQKDDDVAVRELVEKMYDVAEETRRSESGWKSRILHTYDEMVILYQPQGFKAEIALNLSYGFTIYTDSSQKGCGQQLGALELAIRDALLSNGFEQYKEPGMATTEYINEQTGIICSVEEPSLPYSFGCASVNWYDADEMDLVNDLAEAYRAKKSDYPYYISVDENAIEDSGYEQYQRVRVDFMGGWGLFYRVDPKSEWQFFGGGQDAPLCSEFNTEDLKRAFVGRGCRNESTGLDDTVKL